MYLTEYMNGHVHLEESDMYESDGKLFLTEAFNVIMEEILHKGTDLKEKVKSFKNLSSHLTTSSYLVSQINCMSLHSQVCEWKDPDQLRALLDLDLREHGESHKQLLQRVRDVARYSVKTCMLHLLGSHPTKDSY